MISIINYGVGNLQNIYNALSFLKQKSKIISTPQELEKAEKIILPGVGSFGYCIKKIKEFDFFDLLVAKAQNTPFLGICVGMQLLFSISEEKGNYDGLKILQGKIQKLNTKYKVPHIGWNKVFYEEGKSDWFYFVHSYHVIPEENSIITGVCNYGTRVVSIIEKENIWGTQFHPEKSQKAGIDFLNKFAKI